MGPNGSGKSTALKLMAGLIRTNRGKVTVCDKPACRRISEEVAFLSELDAFYSFYTVKETINFYHEPLSGLDPIVRESIIEGLASFIDLEQQTVIMTTHEVSEIEPLLDMVVAIRDGNVLKIEKIDNIREEHNISLVEWMKKVFV